MPEMPEMPESPDTPMSPTPPTSPAGSGPSSVRAIVNWLETSGTNGKAGTLPAVNRGGRARMPGTLASPSPAPLKTTAATTVSSPLGYSADPALPVHRGRGIPGDGSPTRTLPRHKAYLNQPPSQKNGTAEPNAAVRNGPAKKKSYGDLGRSETPSSKTAEAGSNRPRRHKDDVSAYWSSVRKYLFITDKEIYG